MHSFFFTYISNSHSHSHFFIRGTCYFCYFCYRLTILLPLNCVPTQPFLRRDVSGAASVTKMAHCCSVRAVMVRSSRTSTRLMLM